MSPVHINHINLLVRTAVQMQCIKSKGIKYHKMKPHECTSLTVVSHVSAVWRKHDVYEWKAGGVWQETA